MRIMKFAALAAALAIITAACSSDDGGAVSSPPPTSDADVTVTGSTANEWDPADLTIAAGDTVEWDWDGFHNVSFEDDQDVECQDLDDVICSGEATDGGTFTHTFTEAGTFEYVCEVHQSIDMVGTITVT